jgi:hypothetical protein
VAPAYDYVNLRNLENKLPRLDARLGNAKKFIIFPKALARVARSRSARAINLSLPEKHRLGARDRSVANLRDRTADPATVAFPSD